MSSFRQGVTAFAFVFLVFGFLLFGVASLTREVLVVVCATDGKFVAGSYTVYCEVEHNAP